MLKPLVNFLLAGFFLIGTAATSVAAEKITYVLDWLPSGEETPPYVAVKEGYFAAQGLDVSIVTSHGVSDAITKAINGIGEFASGGLGGLMMAEAQTKNGVPMKAVLSIFNKQPDAILAIKGDGITSIQSLAGRTLGTATFTASNAIWPVIAARNGLDLSKVTLIKANPAALAPMLANGRVDALIDWVTSGPGVAAVLNEAGKQMTVIPWSNYGLNGYGLSLFATSQVIEKHPAVVARFVQAFEKAVAFSIAHPRRAAEDLHAMVPEVDVATATREVETTIPLIKNEISAKYGMGSFNPALLKDTWVWVAKAQHYSVDRINPESIVDRSFVPRT